MPLSPSQVLKNRYRIVRLLATGGFGTVYRAWDLQGQCACAVKENLDQTPASQKQFAREADILMGLNHPNLPRVFEHFQDPGQGQFLVMDFIDGEDLETMRNRSGGALAEAVVLPWIRQVMDALTYLHSQNPPVIHRDIKPANICITPQGKAILVDFGIAKTQGSGHTTTGARAVTAGYSPPEQYTGSGTNERSDIYSLGATLYTLLTGTELPESIQRMMSQGKTQPPHLLVPGVRQKVSLAIMQAIQPDQSQRFAAMKDFKAAVFGAGPGQPGSPAWLGKALAAAGGIAVLVGLAFAIPKPGATPTPAVVAASPTPRASATDLPLQASAPTNTPPTASRVPANPTATRAPTTQPELPTPTASPANTKDPNAPPGMVLVPAGSFWMGVTDAEMKWHVSSCNRYARCSEVDYKDMLPRHSVSLDAYYIDIYEVTNADYRRCVEAGKCGKPDAEKIARYLEPDYADNRANDRSPVVAVSWTDAKNYCQWVGGKRLPSEAEWERAARGNDDYYYPWVKRPEGTTAQDVFGGKTPRANFCDNGCPMLNWDETRLSDGWVGPAPVGSYSPGPFGLFDMAGNVSEWTQDVYADDFYQNAPAQNPVNEASGPWRVTRGGGWNNGIYHISAVYRRGKDPQDAEAFIGFRCVKDIP